MEIVSALKPDVYRTVIVVLFPGALAVIPWLVLVFWPELRTSVFWGNGGAAAAALALLVLIASLAGQLLEDVGTRLESDFIDEKAKKSEGTKDILPTFWDYLATPCEQTLVAQRFLSDTLTRYKFELSMFPALLMSSLGLAFAHWLGTGLGGVKTLLLCALQVSIAVWLWLQELPDSARLLHDIRTHIVRAAAKGQA
jgi:hypothetical protein